MAVGTSDTTGPGFMPGILGQAVHIIVTSDNKTNQFVSLGYPPLLHFGSDATSDTTDFSVSMWLKIFGSSGDEPFISNKNWDSGGNLGWVVSNEPDGVRLNLKDDINGRKDMTGHSSPQLEDGHWHHLVVTFQRTNAARIYMDSILDTTHPMYIGPDPGNAVGSLDTDALGNSVNLGQDGTGQYNVRQNTGLNCLMDDVGIWRRVLTADEVAQIYSAGLQGLDIEQSTNAGAFFQAAQPSPGAVAVPGVGTRLRQSRLTSPIPWTAPKPNWPERLLIQPLVSPLAMMRRPEPSATPERPAIIRWM